VVISFDADAIAECERRKPALRTQWLTRYEQQEDGQWRPSEETIVSMMKRSGADALGSMANPEALDESRVRELSAGDVREFGVWTVDDPELARFYIKVGAWSITTNRPAWLREQLGMTKSE
jgi:glycerophosphoryl diester phosphodiesterase